MASDLQTPLPKSDFVALLRDLRSELRQVLTSLEKVVEKIEQVERKLKELESAGAGGSVGPIGGGAFGFARNLEILPCPDGSGAFEVSIDGKEGFILGPRLAGFLEFIATGGRDPAGTVPLVGWRSWDELLSLEDFRGNKLRRPYINSMVNLLRKAFVKKGLHRNLIQSNKKQGVRLALKHSFRGLLRG
jgi:hypothetical protein